MNLDSHQIGYFITQVGLAASSFGVSTTDVTSVATALGEAFDVNCAPPTIVDPGQGPQLQAMCLAADCPKAPKGDCGPYGTSAGDPVVANATLAMGEGKNSTSGNSTAKATGGTGTTGGPKPTKTGASSMGSVVLVECWLAALIALATTFVFVL